MLLFIKCLNKTGTGEVNATPISTERFKEIAGARELVRIATALFSFEILVANLSDEEVVRYAMEGFGGFPGTSPKETDMFGITPEEYREYIEYAIPLARKMLKKAG